MRRTGIIQSERQVFDLAREHFGLDERGGMRGKLFLTWDPAGVCDLARKSYSYVAQGATLLRGPGAGGRGR